MPYDLNVLMSLLQQGSSLLLDLEEAQHIVRPLVNAAVNFGAQITFKVTPAAPAELLTQIAQHGKKAISFDFTR